MHEYIVWASDNMKFRIVANTARGARESVWSNHLAKGYQYGWTKEDFLDNATTEKVS